MARGMVVGEAITSQAQNEAFDEGYSRAFFSGQCRCGHDSSHHEQTRAGRCYFCEGTAEACKCLAFSKAPQRGRWVWDEQARKLVPADEYRAPERAVDAPILSGRFYENTATTDGVDIGSRQKHRAYMRDRGLAPADDFSPGYYDRIRKQSQEQHRKERRETIARRLYEIDKP
jgi:hypothetical protein